ncbi:MAG: hypothetical protein M0Z84_07630 [Gammaproteobacteria bacterium]|nr:hypothetical protein [Gammaproteobacteria bacterium]
MREAFFTVLVIGYRRSKESELRLRATCANPAIGGVTPMYLSRQDAGSSVDRSGRFSRSIYPGSHMEFRVILG